MQDFWIIISTVMLAVALGIMDLKERKIYVFPCLINAALWVPYLFCTEPDFKPVLIYVCIEVGLYMLFTFTHIWGGGDSDFFLLFSSFIYGALRPESTFLAIRNLLLGLAVSLIFSLLIGVIECRVKGQPLRKESSISVVPGFAVFITVLGTYAIIRGCFL